MKILVTVSICDFTIPLKIYKVILLNLKSNFKLNKYSNNINVSCKF